MNRLEQIHRLRGIALMTAFLLGSSALADALGPTKRMQAS
jgi:hypothetical protein